MLEELKSFTQSSSLFQWISDSASKTLYRYLCQKLSNFASTTCSESQNRPLSVFSITWGRWSISIWSCLVCVSNVKSHVDLHPAVIKFFHEFFKNSFISLWFHHFWAFCLKHWFYKGFYSFSCNVHLQGNICFINVFEAFWWFWEISSFSMGIHGFW